MNVRWNEEALADLTEIQKYVADRAGDDVATRLAERILDRSAQIADFPYSGRPVEGYDQTREVFEGPYRILYVTRIDEVEVLMVFHGSRDLSE